MLEGLLKSKFYSKCKSVIKLMRTRIEIMKKKRNAIQKFLRNDISDLLKDGLDIKAYGRADGLVVELNQSSCIELVEQFCIQIADNLGTMDKQMECPKHCREAVSSLMFAAARFAELPELRELRSMFSQRYTNTVDFYVSNQFVEMLKAGHASKEKKLQLLQDIAAESGIEWSSKALENKLYNESAIRKGLKAGEFCDNVRVRRLSVDGSVLKGKIKGRTEYRRISHRTENILPQEIDTRVMERNGQIKEILVDTIGSQPEAHDRKEETSPKHISSERKTNLKDPVPERMLKSTKTDDLAGREKNCGQENSNDNSKPTIKSVRRRYLKSSSAHVYPTDSKSEKSKDLSRLQAAEQCRRVLKFLDLGGSDRQDEEEEIMDRLLLHYSRKKAPGVTVAQNSIFGLPPDHAQGQGGGSSKGIQHRSKDVPNQITSFPDEPKCPTRNTPKRHVRASSLQPEILNHVHPKLPDYDDFVARLASLRGK